MSSGAYIQFQNVKVEYPGHVRGLNGVTFEIEQGEFLFLVGRTGAGKSTILKVLSREVQHTAGSVMLQGQDLGTVRESKIPYLRRRMGIVPQDFALLPRKRVWENVSYAMRAIGHSKREVRLLVPKILEQVNIAHRADAFPHQLSGGEQQRVAIARALINNPPLLLADEPTGNLDPDHSLEIMDLLLQLNAKGTTIIVASHDMLVIEAMKTRTVTLEGGCIVEDVIYRGSTPEARTQGILDFQVAPVAEFVSEIPVEVDKNLETSLESPTEDQLPLESKSESGKEDPNAR